MVEFPVTVHVEENIYISSVQGKYNDILHKKKRTSLFLLISTFTHYELAYIQ